ncbi:helix-turn-helix transcriptional regulator [uncultured Roseibium sp.]|uniref:helix-turn-helix transcriptional regulator n=1 Tax=uncultured Roseibium sp. TaxID=1936171 RepID=UPI00260302C1|nr:helix-turn-helix transcriptional regulator [uncultured Roseibium sp.]
MVVTAEKLVELSNLAAAASIDPAQWQVFLDAMGRALGTQVCTQLIGYDQLTKAAPLAYASGYDPEILHLYETHFADRNPFAENFGRCGIGESITTHELCAPDKLKRTQFYADILQPLEDLYAGGGSMLAFDASRMFLIGGNMRAKDKDKHEDDWLKLCVRLAPVIRQSLEVNRMIMGLKFEKWATERHMLGAGTSVLVVDSAMTVQYACPGGQQLLAEGSLIGCDMFRRVKFGADQMQAQFASLLRGSANGNSDVFSNARLIDSNGCEWICRTLAMSLGDLDRSPFGAFLNGSGNAVLLALKAVDNTSSSAERLQRDLSLSNAEAKTVLMLSNGLSPAEVAAARSVSIHTVRNQIKSALSKSGCRRQGELLQKVEQLRLTGGW